MKDGTNLSARIWFPPEDQRPAPALIEYIPYRKRDLVRARDERNHPFFAENGFVCLRVDMRGSGDSEGRMTDMYSPEEMEDMRQVIEWAAAQNWCSGRVGMFGTSWGGTAALQASVVAPEPLKAVLANCATWDRFEEDIHWSGGCLLTDSLEWGATLPAILACPPDSATVGGQWLELWRQRLKDCSFPVENWLKNSVRGKYWRRGSVRFSTEEITCPVLAVGGWSDRYSSSVMKLVRSRPDICWGVVGPWGHHYPDQGEPGPAIGFQELALEWWDHWLKSDRPGDLDWPRLRIWKRCFDLPQDRLKSRNGNWIEIRDTGDDSVRERCFTEATLRTRTESKQGCYAVPFNVRHGSKSGDTGYFGRTGGLPLDQRADDRRSLCFETRPLESGVDLIGCAELLAAVQKSTRDGQLVCRLCDVDELGRSCLVAWGALNLSLDETLDSHLSAAENTRLPVRLRLPSTVYHFAAGHRLRLALSSSYWPLIWPTSEDPNLRLEGGFRLTLPCALSSDMASAPFPEPRGLPAQKSWRQISEPEMSSTQLHECGGALISGWENTPPRLRFEKTETSIGCRTTARFSIASSGRTHANCGFLHEIKIARPDGEAAVRCELSAVGNDTGIETTGELNVSWNGRSIHANYWQGEFDLGG